MSSFGGMRSFIKHMPEDDWNAGRLVAELPPIAASTSCGDVFLKMHKPDAQRAAAVVDDDGNVVGLVNRLRFLAKYAQRFIPELYDRRPIMTLANPHPLTVDEHMGVSELATIITEDHPDALRECFIVTRQGKYLGIATSEALVRSKVALLTARENQLNSALVAAEDADRTRSNFLALMSHELRTPLNAIIGFSEVLAGGMFGAHTVPQYGEYAKDINNAGKHLLALINDILDLSKSEAAQLELYSAPVDIGHLLRECVKLLSGRAIDGKLSLSLDVPVDLPAVRADEVRLKQIMLNLLSNAVKFTLPGGKVVVSAGVIENGGVEIAVADTGIGMDPATIPIALEPFRQIDSPLSRQVEGTGLGLSLAKSLAERHGGTIVIESALEVGTTVRVQLPPGRTIRVDYEAEAASA